MIKLKFKSIAKYFNFLKKKEFWTIFIPLTGLIITLSPRPIIAISMIDDSSHIDYVSTELRNTGTVPAFDLKYNLFPEIKTTIANYNVENPQNPLFAKGIFSAGQIYQGGRKTSLPPNTQIIELLVRYEIEYKYSLLTIPFLDIIKCPAKITGLLYWNGKRWDTR